MMQGSPTRQKARLGKRDSEHEYEYEYMISDKYPAQWVIIMDKGHQEASDLLHAINLCKKNISGSLGLDDELLKESYPVTGSWSKIFRTNGPVVCFIQEIRGDRE